jgi:aromatic ring hydroxylase
VTGTHLHGLNEATFENTGSENYRNIDNELETVVAVKEIDELIENHQQM